MATNLQPVYAAWRSGRIEDAARICSRVIESHPENAEALQLMGAIHGSRGQHDQAASCFQRAVTLEPRDIALRRNLARAHLQCGRLAQAEEVLLAGIDLRDEDSLWGMLAIVYANSDQLERGIEACEHAIRLNPHSASHLFGLAELQRRQGNRQAAVESLRRAHRLDPNDTNVLNNLAGLELYEGNFLEALRTIQSLLAVNPRSAQAQCNLYTLLSTAGDLEQAVTALRNAVKLDPNLYRARFQLINLLLQTGEVAEAEQRARELLEQYPEQRSACTGLLAKILERRKEIVEARQLLDTLPEEDFLSPELAVTLAVVQDQQGQTAEAIATLRRALEHHAMAITDGIGCHFVLGNFLDKLGQYEEAFEAFAVGNRNRRKAMIEIVERDETAEKALQLIRRVHPKDRYKAIEAEGEPSDVPVFIVGMPRSGTSLSEQILASHPEVYGAGELNTMLKIISESYGKEQTAKGKLVITGIDEYAKQRSLLPKDWYRLTSEALRQLAGQYLAPLLTQAPDAKRITDKMPYNFYVLPVIHKLFPKARIIHCRRHPLDTCLSCFFQNFTAGSQFAFDLQDLGEFYRQYFEIMEYWNELGIPMHNAQYEDLIAEPEVNIRALLDYCGLDWSDGCLNFHRNKRIVHTASYQQVRVPLYNSSVGRWKNYRRQLQPLIESLDGILSPEMVEV